MESDPVCLSVITVVVVERYYQGQKRHGIAVWNLLNPLQLPDTYECRVHPVHVQLTSLWLLDSSSMIKPEEESRLLWQ